MNDGSVTRWRRMLCWFGFHKYEKPKPMCVGFYRCIGKCGSRQLWSMGEYCHTLDTEMGETRLYR